MPYEAVVVGAGINGLAAALHLAVKGWKVIVIERAATAGGAVKTGEITRPGFRHDLYAMNLGLFAGSPFFAAHKDRLIAHGVEFVGAERCFATAFPDGSWLGVEKNLETNADRIAALSPADAERWRAMTAAFGADAPHIFGLLGAPMPSWQALRVAYGAWRARGTAWVAETARLLVASPREWLDENFENAKLKTMMAVWGMHLDFSPGLCRRCAVSVSGMHGRSGFRHGARPRRRRHHRLRINARHHRRRRRSPARRAGAKYRDRERLRERRCACGRRADRSDACGDRQSPSTVLFGGLLPESSAATKRLAKFRLGPATMMIHFALSDLPAWSAGADLRQFAYVHLAPSMAAMAKTYTQALDGYVARRARPRRRPADRHRSVARTARPARAVGPGAGVAVADSRRRRRQHRRHPMGRHQRKLRATAWWQSSNVTRRDLPQKSLAAPCTLPPILNATIRIWSAATASAAVIISIRIFSFVRPSAGRATARRSIDCSWSGRRPGRAAAPAPVRASCWRKCWRVRSAQLVIAALNSAPSANRGR